jgi:hypothetical protein
VLLCQMMIARGSKNLKFVILVAEEIAQHC